MVGVAMESYVQAVQRHLEGYCPGVEAVTLDVFSGCTAQQLAAWEETARPYRMPEDLRAFFEVTNGLSLGWDVRVGTRQEPLGRINVNRIEHVKRIRLGAAFAPDDDDEGVDALFEHTLVRAGDANTARDAPSTPSSPSSASRTCISKAAAHGDDGVPQPLRVAAAFDLDKMCGCGVVALVYFYDEPLDKPRVYFQDMACCWRPLAPSFGEYFRLLMMHLGLPNWQYTFTPYGLDEPSRQWFNFLGPERLAINIDTATLNTRTKTTSARRRSASSSARSAGKNDRLRSYRQPDKTTIEALGTPRGGAASNAGAGAPASSEGTGTGSGGHATKQQTTAHGRHIEGSSSSSSSSKRRHGHGSSALPSFKP